jgi:hypothetical protein
MKNLGNENSRLKGLMMILAQQNCGLNFLAEA